MYIYRPRSLFSELFETRVLTRSFVFHVPFKIIEKMLILDGPLSIATEAVIQRMSLGAVPCAREYTAAVHTAGWEPPRPDHGPAGRGHLPGAQRWAWEIPVPGPQHTFLPFACPGWASPQRLLLLGSLPPLLLSLSHFLYRCSSGTWAIEMVFIKFVHSFKVILQHMQSSEDNHSKI